MKVELNYIKRGWPHNNYVALCPRCDSFESVDEVPTTPQRCVWCQDVELTLACDVCSKLFLTSLDTLIQFDGGKLVAAICESCLDRHAETNSGMLF